MAPYALPLKGGEMYGDTNWKEGTLKVLGNPVWHAGNDGALSGLDADTLDGKQATDFVLSNDYRLSNARTANGGNAGSLGGIPSSDFAKVIYFGRIDGMGTLMEKYKGSLDAQRISLGLYVVTASGLSSRDVIFVTECGEIARFYQIGIGKYEVAITNGKGDLIDRGFTYENKSNPVPCRGRAFFVRVLQKRQHRGKRPRTKIQR